MACEVKKQPQVKNKEGQMVPSKLFNNLLEIVGTVPQAMHYWSYVRSPEFLASHGNWLAGEKTNLILDENGELSIANFKITPRRIISTGDTEVINLEVVEPSSGAWGREVSDNEISTKEVLPENITGYQRIITERKELIKILKRRMSQNVKIKGDEAIRTERIYAKISKLQNTIRTMERKQSLNNYLDVMKGELKSLQDELNTVIKKIHPDASVENTLVRITELRELSHHIKGFTNIFDYLPTSDSETKKRLKEVKSDGDMLFAELLKGLQEAFLYYANQTSFGTQFTEEIYAPQIDIDAFSLKTLGLAYNDSALLKITDDLLRYTEYKINQAYADKRREIESEVKMAEKSIGKSGSDLDDLFLERHENGNWSGNLVSPISPKYRAKRIGMEEKAKQKGFWKAFYNFLDDNEDRMTHEMYSNKTSKFYSKEEHAEQNILMWDYQRTRIAFEDGLRDKEEYTNSEGEFHSTHSKIEFDNEIKKWELINSPFEFWKQREGLIRVDYNRKGDKYIVAPKPKKKNLSSQYLSYFKKGNEGQLRFWNFMQKSFAENRTYMPLNRELQENYLPEVTKTFGSSIGNSPFLEVWKRAGDGLKRMVTDEIAEEYSSTISIAGKDVHQVPTRGMGARLQLEHKSTDLAAILLDNTKMAINYHFKTAIDPVANAVVELFDQMEEKEVKKIKGKELTVKQEGAGIKKTKHRLANSRKHLQSTILASLYDIHKKVEGRTGTRLITLENQKEYNAYKQQLKEKLITKAEFNKKVDEIAREVTSSAVVDTLIKYTYIKALSAPNIISPSVNVLFGTLSNLTYAAAGDHFTTKELLKATSVMFGVLMGQRFNKGETVQKIYAFLDEMNILADVNESNYGSRKGIDEQLVFLQANAEFQNQGAVMLAMLYHTKFKDLNGNTVNAYDAFKVDELGKLQWDVNKMGEQEVVPQEKIQGKHGINMYRFGNRITGINKYLHGDYFSHLEGKTNAVGRMLFLFKTWLPMSIKHRFGKEDFDPNIQETVKGRYRLDNITDTHGEKLSNKQLIQTIVKGIFMGSRSLNELSELDRANITRNVRELHLIATFALVIYGLTMLIGDDSDRKNFRLRILINTLSKAQQDMMLYMQPSAMTQVVNNLIPLVSTINDVSQLTQAAIDLLTGEARYESGPWKDHLKIEPALYKIVPVVNVYPRIRSMGSRLYK